MDILNWKSKGWAGRELELFTEDKVIGNLAFKGWSGYDAEYIAGNTTVSFKNKGWFDQDFTIRYNGQEIGTASVSSLSGKTTLHLLAGEQYTMKSSLFSYDRTVQAPSGETLISFKQGTFNFSNGTIEIDDSLTELTKEVLLSTSLYLKAVAEKQVAIMVTIFMPLLVNAILR